MSDGPGSARADDQKDVAGFAETLMPVKSAVKRDSGGFLPLVISYRILLRPGVEIVQGRLRPGVDPTDPTVRDALTSGGRTVHLSGSRDGVDVLLVRIEDAHRRRWVHLLLFLLTALSVLAAGALFRGVDPLGTMGFVILGVEIPVPTGLDLRQLALGWSFALPLLAVLAVHEGGHLAAARRHGVPATLPYFIPMPPYLSIIGTLGAFIRLRGPIVHRNALMDIGAWGPLAGFALAAPLFAWGLTLSGNGFGAVDELTPWVIRFAGQPVWLGASPVTLLLGELFGPGTGVGPVLLHPVAIAGWLGLFLTALNLVPVGQLDGGHILYALGEGVQRTAGRLGIVALAILGAMWWGWWFWAGLVLLLHQGRIVHPPLFQESVPLSPGRCRVGLFTILVFFLTFAPIPIQL